MDCLREILKEAGIPVPTRQERWQMQNMRVVSCKISLSEAERFRRLCERYGVTRYQVLCILVRRFLSSNQPLDMLSELK